MMALEEGVTNSLGITVKWKLGRKGTYATSARCPHCNKRFSGGGQVTYDRSIATIVVEVLEHQHKKHPLL